MHSATSRAPSPDLFYETVKAYQRTAALKTALELDVFTAVGTESVTASDLAARCNTSTRGMRILCDYLVVAGFLIKEENRYQLTEESAAFLNRNAPDYIGSAANYLKPEYDVAILANLLHHFDRNACIQTLRIAYRCLKPGGRAAILEFIPNDDRISPPEDAAFALTVLATTPSGDVYTFREWTDMCRAAGFSLCSIHTLEHGEQPVVIAQKT